MADGVLLEDVEVNKEGDNQGNRWTEQLLRPVQKLRTLFFLHRSKDGERPPVEENNPNPNRGIGPRS